MKLIFLLLFVSFSSIAQRYDWTEKFRWPAQSSTVQIGEYIRRIFQDRDGNMWFGTQGEGVGRYDGKWLTYFTEKDGLGGNVVRSMAQDKEGNIWLGTSGGVTRYDGKTFTNFNEQDGLLHHDVWSILIDRTGKIWVGTFSGVSYLTPTTEGASSWSFTTFSIPPADTINSSIGVRSQKVIWSMMEDRAGNIWFATNGGGAYRYDGKSLTHITRKDGLTDNSVQTILEDKKGNIWFATRYKGVSRYDPAMAIGPGAFTNFTTKEGLPTNAVYALCEDNNGNIWIGTLGEGALRYDGKTFTNVKEKQGLTRNHVQSIYQDRNGTLWFGFSGGLFRLDGKVFINITTKSILMC